MQILYKFIQIASAHFSHEFPFVLSPNVRTLFIDLYTNVENTKALTNEIFMHLQKYPFFYAVS